MKHLTPKQSAETFYAVDPSELESVITVYRELVYIPRNRKPNSMIPMYKQDGKPVLERTPSGKDWRRVYLHPGNIYSPAMHPLPGDYMQLLDADNKPSENHAEVFMCSNYDQPEPWIVETMNGESYTVTRLPELDNNIRRAWRQVVTS